MLSFKGIGERLRENAAAAAEKAGKPKRRVRFVEKGNVLVAQVDEWRGLKWVPTEVIEEVDLNRVAAAERAASLINAGKLKRTDLKRVVAQTRGDTGCYDTGCADTGMSEAATPFGHFLNVPTGDTGMAEAASTFGHFLNVDAEEADTAGFWKKVKKAAKKIAKNKVVKVIAKAHTVPLKAVHKVTHGKNSPIRKAELALQKTITKNLPITKPFIAVHNKIAGATHKVIEGKKTGKKPSIKDIKDVLPNKNDIAALAETKKRMTADAIAKQLKKVPKAQQAEAREALVKQATSWIVISPKTGITHTLKL